MFENLFFFNLYRYMEQLLTYCMDHYYTFGLRAGTLMIYTSSDLLMSALRSSGLRCQTFPVQPIGVPGFLYISIDRQFDHGKIVFSNEQMFQEGVKRIE